MSGPDEEVLPGWVSELVGRCGRIESLLVSAYIDLNRDRLVSLYSPAIFLKIDDGYVRLSLDGRTDQIQLGFSTDARPAPELYDDPSRKPAFVDLGENFLGDAVPAWVTSVSLLVDQFSDPRRGFFRGIILRQPGNEGLAFVPHARLGIRLAVIPDLGRSMSGLDGVEAKEISIAS